MFEFFALLLGITLPVGVGLALLRRGKSQLDSAVAYRQVARGLGLMVDTRGVSLQGHVGERRLWVGEVMMGHGPDRPIAIWGVVDLERPLGLGIQVRRRGLSERVFRRGRAPGVELGDEMLDRKVEIRGDDPRRVRALLGDRDVKAALTALIGSWPDVVVTDASVRVHLHRAETSERRLQELVDGMLGLSRALEHARSDVPAPDRLAETVQAFETLAAKLEVELEPWLPALVGCRNEREVRLTVFRADTGYEADLRVFLKEHRDLGLRLRPQVEPDGYWSVGQDIQVGSEAFDQAFVIKGWDPGRVRETIGPRTQAALLHLGERGRVRLDDKLLEVRRLPLDIEVLEQAVLEAEAVADALGW